MDKNLYAWDFSKSVSEMFKITTQYLDYSGTLILVVSSPLLKNKL